MPEIGKKSDKTEDRLKHEKNTNSNEPPHSLRLVKLGYRLCSFHKREDAEKIKKVLENTPSMSYLFRAQSVEDLFLGLPNWVIAWLWACGRTGKYQNPFAFYEKED